MHEYGLTEKIVRTASETAAANRAKKVTAVYLVIGETSGVLTESVQMYFDLIAEGTEAAGALLKIKTVKPEMYCSRCGKNFIRQRCSFDCPVCGGTGSPTEVGREFYIDKIELEV